MTGISKSHLNYIEKGFNIIVGILILIFIKEQIDAGENLKFIIYIIRFIVNFIVLLFWGEVITELKELFDNWILLTTEQKSAVYTMIAAFNSSK